MCSNRAFISVNIQWFISLNICQIKYICWIQATKPWQTSDLDMTMPVSSICDKLRVSRTWYVARESGSSPPGCVCPSWAPVPPSPASPCHVSAPWVARDAPRAPPWAAPARAAAAGTPPHVTAVPPPAPPSLSPSSQSATKRKKVKRNNTLHVFYKLWVLMICKMLFIFRKLSYLCPNKPPSPGVRRASGAASRAPGSGPRPPGTLPACSRSTQHAENIQWLTKYNLLSRHKLAFFLRIIPDTELRFSIKIKSIKNA